MALFQGSATRHHGPVTHEIDVAGTPGVIVEGGLVTDDHR
jgi:hypothetical protein